MRNSNGLYLQFTNLEERMRVGEGVRYVEAEEKGEENRRGQR